MYVLLVDRNILKEENKTMDHVLRQFIDDFSPHLLLRGSAVLTDKDPETLWKKFNISPRIQKPNLPVHYLTITTERSQPQQNIFNYHEPHLFLQAVSSLEN